MRRERASSHAGSNENEVAHTAMEVGCSRNRQPYVRHVDELDLGARRRNAHVAVAATRTVTTTQRDNERNDRNAKAAQTSEPSKKHAWKVGRDETRQSTAARERGRTKSAHAAKLGARTIGRPEASWSPARRTRSARSLPINAHTTANGQSVRQARVWAVSTMQLQT